MKEDDLKLVHRLKQGDLKAYRELYKKHYVLLCKVAVEFLRDDFTAETIVNDVIVSLWERRAELDIQSSLRSYLLRAVRYQCINHLEKEYNKREISFSKMGDADPTHYLTLQSDYYPLGSLLERELEDKIANAINKLPKETQTVFRLSRFDERSYKEIADELDISVNTVKYHIKRALSLLTDDLKKYLILLVCILACYLK